MRRNTHTLTLITLSIIALSTLTTGCGSGGALGQLVTAAFSPQAAVSDLQIKGVKLGDGSPIADILARLTSQVIKTATTTPAPAQAQASAQTPDSGPGTSPDGFPENAEETPVPAPALDTPPPVVPPELAAILNTALEEKYILDVALVGQAKTVRLVCSGKEEVAKCMKIPRNSSIMASVVPIEANLFDVRRIVED